MTPRRRNLLIAAVALSAIAGAASFETYHYVQHDPRFCTSCHLMDDAYGRWAKSEHSQIECHACHVSDLKGNLHRLYNSVFDPKKEIETHAEVDRTVCLTCHEARGGERWKQVTATQGHKAHVAKAQCVECHSKTVHVFTPPADVCVECHDKVQLHETGMAELECLDCHDFLSRAPGKHGLLPRSSDCRRCHGGPGLLELTSIELEPGAKQAKAVPRETTHGGVDCRSCHDPHASDVSRKRAGALCARCHRGMAAAVAGQGPEEHQRCGSCHQAHDMPGAALERCAECHATKKQVMTSKGHQGKCTTCHAPHRFEAAGQDCRACHKEKAEALFAAGVPDKHSACESCHEPHSGLPGSAACVRCHDKRGDQVASARPDEHRRCASCHEPHGPKPQANAACRECHQAETKLVATSSVAKHAACGSCHGAPHGEPRLDRAACAECHQKEVTLAATAGTPGDHKRCASCHVPHGAGIAGTTKSCGECHAGHLAGSVDDVHGGGKCFPCHQPHGPPEAKRATCKECHDKVQPKAQLAARAAHLECKNCHRPHGAKQRGGSRCTTCHDKESRSLAVWTSSGEHQRCVSCHPGHDAGEPKACGGCHAAEQSRVAGTKHSNCTSCHAPHATEEIGAEAWRRRCTSCHEKNASVVASRGPTHRTCASCHGAHPVTPAGCGSCHNAIRGQLMHQVASHQKCESCHDAHADRRPTRAMCTTGCHTDRAKHFPETSRCDACHPFAEGRPQLGRLRPREEGLPASAQDRRPRGEIP